MQLTLAALLGLFSAGVDSLLSRVDSDQVPHVVPRGLFVLRNVSGPGVFPGHAVVGALDGFGVVGNEGHLISRRQADRIADLLTVLFNMAIYALFWFMLQTGSKESKRRKIAIVGLTIWLVVVVPMSIFGSMFMTL